MKNSIPLDELEMFELLAAALAVVQKDNDELARERLDMQIPKILPEHERNSRRLKAKAAKKAIKKR